MATSNARLMALAAGGSAIAIAAIVGAVVAVKSCADPSTPTDGPDVPTQAASVASAGMHARGTAELRQLGCDEPVVIDMLQLLGDAGAVREGEPRYMVTCDVSGSQPPTCERAAATYFGALGGTADGNVVIRVAKTGSLAPICSRLYAPSGAALK